MRPIGLDPCTPRSPWVDFLCPSPQLLELSVIILPIPSVPAKRFSRFAAAAGSCCYTTAVASRHSNIRDQFIFFSAPRSTSRGKSSRSRAQGDAKEASLAGLGGRPKKKRGKLYCWSSRSPAPFCALAFLCNENGSPITRALFAQTHLVLLRLARPFQLQVGLERGLLSPGTVASWVPRS